MEKSYTGHIQLILGPMFSGKSTELLRRVKKFKFAKKKVLLVKYLKDTRYSVENISTHDMQQMKAFPTDKLFKLKKHVKDHDVVAIDEGQFFSDLIDFSEYCADHGKIVIIASLDGDFRRQTFGDVCKLVPKCESIVKLKAICMFCQNEASFTSRITDETDTEVIGGSDKYVSTCRMCFNQNPMHKKQKKLVSVSDDEEDEEVQKIMIEKKSSPSKDQVHPKKIRFVNDIY